MTAVAVAAVAACTPNTGGGGTTTTTPGSTTVPTAATAPLLRRQPLGVGGVDPTGSSPSTSADGTRVAFLSDAPDLVAGAVPSPFSGVTPFRRVYVWATDTDVVLAQPDAALGGAAPNADVGSAVISGDGSAVAFASRATNLLPLVAPERDQLFVWNVASGSVQRGPSPVASVEGRLTMSRNGRRVGYTAAVTNPNAPLQRCPLAQVWDLDLNVVVTQPVPATFDWANCGWEAVSLSPDGRYVAFDADSPALTPGDTNQVSDVYLWDVLTGTVTRAVGPAGESNAPSFAPSVADGGTSVAFVSQATNLVPGRGAGIYVWTPSTGGFDPEPLGVAGAIPGVPTNGPVVSADGRTIAFSSGSPRLVPGDTNGVEDVFVWSRPLGTVSRVAALGGANPDGTGEGPLGISADGRYVPLSSEATNLLANRAASTTDRQVYLLDRSAAADRLDTAAPAWPAGGRLVVTRTQSGLTVEWPAAIDDRAVTGYRVIRDGTVAATVASTQRQYAFPTQPTTTTIEVDALDASGRSTALTQAVTTSRLFGPSRLGVSDVHACAVTPNAGLRCWGANESGELGNGSTSPSAIAVDVPGLTGVVDVAVAYNWERSKGRSCAVLSGGSVSCWGQTYVGSDDQMSTTPTTVPGISGARDVAAALRNTCVLLSNGTVKCWGTNVGAELGNGTTTDSFTPTDVVGVSNAVAITAGEYHSCALISDGTVRCWGSNVNGALGDGTRTTRTSAVQVVGVSGATAVIAGSSGGTGITCAITPTGVKCWGQLSTDLTGSSSTINPTPVTVASLAPGTVVSMSVDSHICAVRVDGTVRCLGNNNVEQAGTPSLTRVTSFTTVDGVAEATAIEAGSVHTCALIAGGTARCWGAALDGTTTPTHSSVPQTVQHYTTPACSVRGPNADLRRCDLSGAQLGGTSFANADLTGANLSGANLSSAIFPFASVHAANFAGADLHGANLGAGNFTGASFRNANLRNVNFIAPIAFVGIGANLTNADMTNADLTGATGLASFGAALPTTLTGVHWENTTCPNGTVRSTPCA